MAPSPHRPSDFENQTESPKPITVSAKQAAYHRGRRAERLALLFLWLKGYRLLARGYRRPVGEIDLILKRGKMLVFVEVKRRATLATAAEAISHHQRRRIQRAAEAFLQENPALLNKEIRFDALLLVPGRWPHHLPAAWRT